jgi:hypothetical protein
MHEITGSDSLPTPKQFVRTLRGLRTGAPLLELFERYSNLEPDTCEVKDRSVPDLVSDFKLPTNLLRRLPYEIVAETGPAWQQRINETQEPDIYAPLTLVATGRGGFFKRLTVMVCPHPDSSPMFGVPEADPVGYLDIGWDLYPYPKRMQNATRARARLNKTSRLAPPWEGTSSPEVRSFRLLEADLDIAYEAFLAGRSYTVKSAPWAQLAAIDTSEFGWRVYNRARITAQTVGNSMISRIHNPG